MDNENDEGSGDQDDVAGDEGTERDGVNDKDDDDDDDGREEEEEAGEKNDTSSSSVDGEAWMVELLFLMSLLTGVVVHCARWCSQKQQS